MDIVKRLIKEAKKEPPGYLPQVAKATGVTLRTLRNLRYGVTTSMRYESMVALQKYFAKRDARGND